MKNTKFNHTFTTFYINKLQTLSMNVDLGDSQEVPPKAETQNLNCRFSYSPSRAGVYIFTLHMLFFKACPS